MTWRESEDVRLLLINLRKANGRIADLWKESLRYDNEPELHTAFMERNELEERLCDLVTKLAVAGVGSKRRKSALPPVAPADSGSSSTTIVKSNTSA